MVTKFLVASNDDALVRSVQTALQGDQREIIAVRDGLSAVDMALDQRAQVIFIDVQLPGLSGIDVARALRALDPTERVPIIFFAKNQEEEKLVADARLPLVEHINTALPLKPADLQLRTENALKMGQQANEVQGQRPNDTMLAILDPLTRLYHRRYLLHRLAYEAARSVRYSNPLSVLIVDIDNLKSINNQYGTLTGDNVLIETGQLIRKIARIADIVGRSDTKDFMVLAPETNELGAMALGNRIRRIISENHFVATRLDLHVTVSVGVATAEGNDLAENLALFGRAEAALERAKKAGKNRVESA
jgi:diguanylate cyclase (GGDEF)-like protein